MKHTQILTTAFLFFAFSLNLSAQHWTFFDTDDARGRGYTDRPYKRYEAEPDWSQIGGNAAFLPRTFDQRTVQSEASNQQAVQLNNVGDYVQWTNNEAADGMVIRFSIPDSPAGTGTTGKLHLYVGDDFVQEIEINSYWAWQYFQESMWSSYPDNTAAVDKFPRMRFDEKRVRLDKKIPKNAAFKLVKADTGAGAYTIDFVELEPIPAMVAAPEGAIVYENDGSDLATFLAKSENMGKTIYIPEGKYDVPVRLYVFGNGTKLIGAGMWYTQLHFTASPNSTLNNPKDPSGYNARGFESGSSDVEVSGFYITTENERRYAGYYSSGLQVGKGFNGSFGKNSKISDVWVTHFECGGWIEGADGLHILHSRFRNNYADGINLSRGCRNSIVEQCSFRNNGDDDMASWSRDGQATVNNTYQYNTSENCWRAAAIGFFGGRQNKALNCVIIDPIEAGIRYNNDFDGAPFSDQGYFEVRNVSIYNAGNKPGVRGVSGDLWGARTAALFINSANNRYDVKNAVFSNIDIYNSKGDAVLVQSRADRVGEIHNIMFENITVYTINTSDVGNTDSYYGLRFNNAKGANNYFCINFENVADNLQINSIPAGFTVMSDCNTSTRTLRVNETLDLNDFVPENFSENLNFSIASGIDVVSVNNGIVAALAEGTAQITVTDAENTFTFIIIVKDVAVTGISLLPETLRIPINTAFVVTATVLPANATNKTYTWSSSDATIAAISASGRITARKEGSVIITVTTEDGEYTATCEVTVLPKDSALGNITAEDCVVNGYFNILGQKLNDAPEQGIYIETYEKCPARKFVK